MNRLGVACVVAVVASGCLGEVSDVDAGLPDAAVDAVDAGAVDAGVDAGVDDAGADAGDDAGVDGGADAGVDAGAPDVCDAWDGIWRADAFDVTPADAPQLQALLDTHRVLRLAPGDYRTAGPASVRLSSHQQVLALLPTRFPDVVVAAGTERARLRGLREGTLSFEPGAPIRHNCFSHLGAMRVSVDGASVEQNQFFAINTSTIAVDTSDGGVFSDNRVMKFNSHGGGLAVELRGDAARRSGGNAFLLYDSLTASGSAFYVAGQRDIAFIGINAEAYNWLAATPTPYLFQVRNTGTFRGARFIGVTKHSGAAYPALDLEADRVLLHRANINVESPTVWLRAGTQLLFSSQSDWDATDVIDDAPATGLRVYAQPKGIDVGVHLDGAELTSPPGAAAQAALRELLSGADRDGGAWPIPEFRPIPDPTGPNWNQNLAAAPDDTDAIEQLIADGGIAQLDARTYYISRPLVLGAGQGIVGKGAGRTAIVAKSDIDMVRIEFGDPNSCGATTAGVVLAELTLQGGANGIHSSFPGTQVNHSVLSHVTFRNMSNAGIFVDLTYGWDNNTLDYVNFVDCAYGFRQRGGLRPSDACYPIGEWSTMGYVDKVAFYRNQFVRCGRAFVMEPTRPNHLDAIIESSFVDNAQSAIELNGPTSGSMVVSSRFENNGGAPSIRGAATLVNCELTAGPAASLLGPGCEAEGSTFRRGASTTATIFGDVQPGDWRNPNHFNVWNSVATDIPLGPVESTLPTAGLYVNNALVPGDPMGAFFTSLAYRSLGTPTSADDTRSVYVLLSGPPSPGSQWASGGRWW